MEGAGIEAGMLTFFEEDIPIKGVIHDHDGKTMKIIERYYPDAIEMNDPAHIVKLFKKKIIHLGKSETQLRGLGDKWCGSMLMYAIRNCDGQKYLFKQLIIRQYEHICNISHQHCSHDKDYKQPRRAFVTSKSARDLLWAELSKLIDDSEKYMNNYGTNTVEAFNHEITKFCSKQYNFHVTYTLRANLAALARVLPRYKIIIMDALNIPLSNGTQSKLLKEVSVKERLAEQRSSKQYKQKQRKARRG